MYIYTLKYVSNYVAKALTRGCLKFWKIFSTFPKFCFLTLVLFGEYKIVYIILKKNLNSKINNFVFYRIESDINSISYFSDFFFLKVKVVIFYFCFEIFSEYKITIFF